MNQQKSGSVDLLSFCKSKLIFITHIHKTHASWASTSTQIKDWENNVRCGKQVQIPKAQPSIPQNKDYYEWKRAKEQAGSFPKCPTIV